MQWARKNERERKKRERDGETEEEKKKGKKRKEKLYLVLRSCSAPACSDSRAVDIRLWAYSFSKHWLILCDWPCAGSWEYRHE